MSAVAEKKPEETKLIVPDAREERTSPHAVPAPSTLMQALSVAAADPRMELAKVQGLWVMHKEMMDREAERAFADALALSQMEIQPVARDRRNDHTRSNYATLAAIVDEVTPIMAKNGLAISFDTYDPVRDKDLPALTAGWVRVIALVSHRGGHLRRYHLDGPLDDKGTQGATNKTGIQAMGSTVQYLRRYLVCMIGNVATMEAENDGNAPRGGSNSGRMDEKVLADHLAAMDSAADEAGMLKAFALAYNQAEDLKDKDSQRVLMSKRDECRKKLKAGRR